MLKIELHRTEDSQYILIAPGAQLVRILKKLERLGDEGFMTPAIPYFYDELHGRYVLPGFANCGLYGLVYCPRMGCFQWYTPTEVIGILEREAGGLATSFAQFNPRRF